MNDPERIRPIIGLEIHVHLLTATKMFCGCPIRYDAPPNTCVCPVCLGHPGALPVMNRRALHLTMLTGLALNCEVARHTKWDRKSYYYPDMPKNYQISQYDLPLCLRGAFEIDVNGGRRRVRIKRAHLEEDAGKNLHDPAGWTLVDLNRAGTPLLEIVTEPDLGSAEEAFVFCTELQRLVTYLGVSEASMQKGQMRFEPNVNVAIQAGGSEYRTPIVEIKNLNSFKAVRSAIAFEIDRQVETWCADHGYVLGQAPNENRGWNDDGGFTEYQRPKEAAHDYRYFPDPDLVPVDVTDDALAAVRAELPELPISRRRRFITDYRLQEADVETIVADRGTADLFEEAVVAGAPPEVLGKQFVNVWLKHANERGVAVTGLPVDADCMSRLAEMVSGGSISATSANRLAAVMLDRTDGPAQIAEELGLLQTRDAGTVEAWVDEAFAANGPAVKDALSNPKKAKAAIGFLRGQVMRISGGKADPKLVGPLIEKRLAEMRSE